MASAAPLQAREPLALLGPSTGLFFAAADAIGCWAMTAAPGEACIYARAVRLPRSADGAARARALGEAGILSLHCSRHHPRSTLFDYLARRTARPLTSARRAAPNDETLAPDERIVLAYVEQLADRGLPCPPNRVISEASGLGDPRRVGGVMMRLRDLGAIAVEFQAVEPLRIVTIRASGSRTAERMGRVSV